MSNDNESFSTKIDPLSESEQAALRAHSGKADLVFEPPGAEKEGDSQTAEIVKTLDEHERQILEVASSFPDAGPQTQGWRHAREVIDNFRPVPWFIWRISNYVLRVPGKTNKLSEGFVMGLRRLLFAAASDKILGTGTKVNDLRKALSIVPHDAVAAVSVIHGVSRRLANHDFERIWRPILEDAILRAHIGCFVGERDEAFGLGRGMLAGFAGRAGLAILISCGELEQAKEALESLAAGEEISEVGYKVYKCDPLQVSAMLLSASGCGRDAAFGTVAFAASAPLNVVQNDEQKKWLAAFVICENLRTGRVGKIEEQYWEILGFHSKQERKDLVDTVKIIARKGHGWGWLS